MPTLCTNRPEIHPGSGNAPTPQSPAVRNRSGALAAAFTLLICVTPFETRGQLRPDILAGPAIVGQPHANTGFAITMRPYHLTRGGLVLTPQATIISTPSRVFDRATLTIGELVVAADLRQGGFRPIIGGGAGFALAQSGSGLSFHAMEGFRADLGRRIEVLFEARQRTLPRQSTSFEIVAGFSVDLSR